MNFLKKLEGWQLALILLVAVLGFCSTYLTVYAASSDDLQRVEETFEIRVKALERSQFKTEDAITIIQADIKKILQMRVEK